MAHFESISAGFPCWLELGTTDQSAAKKFYSAIFGWSAVDYPMGPAEFYTMFGLNGRNVSAGYALSDELRADGVPPHWAVYFAVASADDTVAHAEALGAKIVLKPLDVMEVGRMAIMQDPTASLFSIWQPRSHKGFGIAYEPNALAWSELVTRDPECASGFYSSLFGWETRVHPNVPSGYLVCRNAGFDFGGILRMTEEWGEIAPHWNAYWNVSDCDATAAKVKELGGSIMHGPFDAPGVGRIAICADPQGANFNLFHPLG